MRQIIPFNADWFFSKTGEVPAELPQTWERVTLPHTWNAIDGQDGGNDYWRGMCVGSLPVILSPNTASHLDWRI